MATDATWAALADPHRRAVLGVLVERAHAVGELVERTGLSQPQASKHLRVLRDAGLVRAERRAQRRIYSVDPGPMVEVDAWLQPYRQLWNDRLDRLGEHLEASDGDG
jgi:DNA-binding transcriptional ArsR family regulator